MLGDGKGLFFRSTWVALAVVACTMMAGCGEGGKAKVAKVSGKLTYKGAALANVTVTFTPEKGRPATGETDAEGKFKLSTFGSNDGAVLGLHKVTLGDKPAGGPPPMPGTPEAATSVAQVDRFPAKYKDVKTTTLEFEVKSGSNTWEQEITD